MFLFLLRSLFGNSDDPDEMPHYAAFHLGLHYLPKYLLYLGVTSIQKVNRHKIVMNG